MKVKNKLPTLTGRIIHLAFNHQGGSRIDGVMVRVLASSAVGRGFEPRSCQTKGYTIVICCFSAKHSTLSRKSKDWLVPIQNNVSEWSDMNIRGLLFH